MNKTLSTRVLLTSVLTSDVIIKAPCYYFTQILGHIPNNTTHVSRDEYVGTYV